MKVEWDKVTWYSKCAAIALFIVLSCAGFNFGEKYGEIRGFLKGFNIPPNATSQSGADYYQNTAAWQTSRNDAGKLSISYPIDFDTNDNHSIIPIPDWRGGTPGGLGLKPFTLAIPKAFEPQTNFNEATLSIGMSGNRAAIARCLTPDTAGGEESTSTAAINGIVFLAIDSADAGAGNFYETTSYRTIHAGRCYAVEYTIHSSQIINYPASYELRPFDKAKVRSLLDRIIGTFRFE